AKAIERTHWLYAQYINRLHRRSGHLGQDRFYSNALNEDHCLLAMRYTERNPIRAGMCRMARRYAWSSAAAHCGGKDGFGLLDLKAWQERARGLDWEGELAVTISPAELSKMRRAWDRGRPLAEDRF